MSEVAQVALITGGVGFLSLLVSLWFTARTRKDDREQRATERREDYQEWYKHTLFEKRLEAIQEGRHWITRLNEGLNHPDKELDNLKLLNLVSEARGWYAKNAFHIHGGVPHNCALERLLYDLEWSLLGHSDMPSNDIWREARDLVGTKAEEVWRSPRDA